MFSLVRDRYAASLRRGCRTGRAAARSYFGARSLPLRFLAVKAIRIRWELGSFKRIAVTSTASTSVSYEGELRVAD